MTSHRQNRLNSSKRKTFSLIELLVAIAILAILSSLLSPSLKKAMASAHDLSCRKNLSSQLCATQLYLTDHDEFFWEQRIGGSRSDKPVEERGPIYDLTDFINGQSLEESSLTNSGTPYTNSSKWGSHKPILSYYMGASESFHCPSYELDDQDELIRWSYGFVSSYDNTSLSNYTLPASSLGAIGDIYNYPANFAGVQNYKDIITRRNHFMARHNFKANIGFLDGHVGALGVEELSLEMIQIEQLGYIKNPDPNIPSARNYYTGGWGSHGPVGIP